MAHITDSSKIPVILAVDVEPDEFFVDRTHPKPWSGFEFSHEYLKDLRNKLEDSTGHNVHFCWSLRMDPQVAIAYGSSTWVADRYAAFLEEYRSNGDDLGIHVHTYRWSDSRSGWLDDCGNPEWVTECLESSVDSFKHVFGEPSRTLRFGNFWLSTQAVNQAENLGIEYDLTIEPGLQSRWHFENKPPQSGPTPDFYRVPRFPYSPSRSDFRKQNNGGSNRNIVMMPLTSAYRKFGWRRKAWGHRLHRLRCNGIHGRLQNSPLSMWRKWNGHNSYTSMLDRAIALQEKPYLAFAIRSSMHGKNFPVYDSNLKTLLNHSASSRFIFCTPQEAMDRLTPC
jgi:hypothetical protein